MALLEDFVSYNIINDIIKNRTTQPCMLKPEEFLSESLKNPLVDYFSNALEQQNDAKDLRYDFCTLFATICGYNYDESNSLLKREFDTLTYEGKNFLSLIDEEAVNKLQRSYANQKNVVCMMEFVIFFLVLPLSLVNRFAFAFIIVFLTRCYFELYRFSLRSFIFDNAYRMASVIAKEYYKINYGDG